MPSTANTVAELQVRISADTKDAESGLSSLGSKLGSVGGTLATAFGGAAIAGIAGLAAGFTGAVGAAAGFEKQMSAISAVSGATGDEMATLKGLALDLGKSTSFSASEAANGIEELIKAGVSIGDVMGGAASASLSLAAAGAISVGDAAEIASNAMNAFGLKGADLGKVADTIAGAANASAISVNDFKFSLGAVGAVANAAGISFSDTAVAIAELGQAGIKGSDAGTSLKALIAGLTPSSKTATAAMRELGLITASGANQFFTAEGKMKSMAEIQQLLQDSTKNLTAEQKLMKLETIFGSDAIRAAAVLAKEGASGFDAMSTSMGKVTAEMVATERLNNLAGSWEQLTGSVETLAITFGMAFLPLLKGATDGLTGFVNALIPIAEQWGPLIVQTVQSLGGYFRAVAEDGDYLNDFLTELPGPIQGVVLAIGTAVSAIQSLMTIFGGGEWGEASTAAYENLVQIFGPDATNMVLEFIDFVIAGVQAVADFAIRYFSTIVDWVTDNWPLIQKTVEVVLAAIALLWETHGENILTIIESAWTIITTVIEGALDIVLSALKIAMQLITGDWEGAWETLTGVTERTLDRLGTIIGAAWDAIVALIDMQTGVLIDAVTTWLSDTGTAISDGWDSIKNTMQGAWDGFLSLIQGALDSIKTAISTVWNQIPEDIRVDLEKIASHLTTQGGVWVTNVTTAGSNMLTAITTKLGEMVTAVTTWASDFLSPITALVGTATSAATSVATSIWTAITTKLAEIITAISTWGGNVVSTIAGFVGSVGSAAASIGQSIIDGIVRALGNGVQAIKDAAYRAVRSALDVAMEIIKPGSPSKVFTALGETIPEGLAKGILSGSGLVGMAMKAMMVPVVQGVSATVDAASTMARGMFLAAERAAAEAAWAISRGSLPDIAKVMGALGATMGQNVNTIRQFSALASGSIIPGQTGGGAEHGMIPIGPGTYRSSANSLPTQTHVLKVAGPDGRTLAEWHVRGKEVAVDLGLMPRGTA